MQNSIFYENIAVPLLYIEVFALMFVSFLIGYLFAFYYQKSRYEKRFKKLIKVKETALEEHHEIDPTSRH